jgi:hypothetical protein
MLYLDDMLFYSGASICRRSFGRYLEGIAYCQILGNARWLLLVTRSVHMIFDASGKSSKPQDDSGTLFIYEDIRMPLGEMQKAIGPYSALCTSTALP